MTQLDIRPDIRAVGARVCRALLEAGMVEDLPRTVDEIVATIEAEIPDYARLEEEQASAIRSGIEQWWLGLLRHLADPSQPFDAEAGIHRQLGREALRDGRSLGGLQNAYRVGARIAWPRIYEIASASRLPTDELCLIAGAVFANAERVSGYATEGYETERISTVGALQRRRRRLLELILSEPPLPRDGLESLAASARWKLPALVACAIVDGGQPGGQPGMPLAASQPSPGPSALSSLGSSPGSSPGPSALSSPRPGALDGQPEIRPDVLAALELDDALVDLERRDPVLLVPGDAEATAAVGAALDGWLAVIGPPVPLRHAIRSLSWARRTLALVHRGVIAADGVIHSTDHLPTLMLSGSEGLVEVLGERSLAPLSPIRPKVRHRLEQTLLAWLESGEAGAPEVAARLRVHPQTVRNRFHQLEELFGDRLRDPRARFELRMVLRARTLLERPAPAGASMRVRAGHGADA